MQKINIWRSMALRRTIAFTLLFVISCILLFGSIYQHMATWERTRIKKLLEEEAHAFSQASDDQLHWSINKHVNVDRHQITFTALFDSNLRYIEGNITLFPRSLPDDGIAHELPSVVINADRPSEPIIFVALRLPNSHVLLIGRTIQDLDNLREAVVQALKLGILSIALPVIFVGIIFTQRMSRRLKNAQRILTSFQEGQLHQRLPVSRSADELDVLSTQVNSMLNELERVVNELRHAGNNIAHDLRTPLARVQASLENAQRLMAESDAAFPWIDRAIDGLNQTFALTTALLRVAHIESGKARAFFKVLDLSKLVAEVAELYGPVAEARGIALDVNIQEGALVIGDRDLLLEAVANLLDNAIKFSPELGRVIISSANQDSSVIVSVADTGPGISEREKAEIFKRFYRCAQSRHIPGNGLGLALVAAIARLHNFSIEVKDGSPGSIFELHCAVPTAPRYDDHGSDREWDERSARKNDKSQSCSRLVYAKNSVNEFAANLVSAYPRSHPIRGILSAKVKYWRAHANGCHAPSANLRFWFKPAHVSGAGAGRRRFDHLIEFLRTSSEALVSACYPNFSRRAALYVIITNCAFLFHSAEMAAGYGSDESREVGQSRERDSTLENIASIRRELKELKREEDPLRWAMTQNNLGAALLILGEREHDSKPLEDAIAAFQEAVKELTYERAPVQWAMAESNLAAALVKLGEQRAEPGKLEDAATRYREVLKEFTRERAPTIWASTQLRLADTLGRLGERENGTASLEEAVKAYREVLKEKARERVPFEWANAQSSLGAALLDIGKRKNGTVELEEAVTACRAALQEFTRERSPTEWAATQNNLGNTLARLGRRKNEPSMFEGAVAAYRNALKEFTRERAPFEWASIQNDLGSTLFELGKRESGTTNLEAAVVALREALKELTNETSPYSHSLALENLNQANALLMQRRRDARHRTR